MEPVFAGIMAGLLTLLVFIAFGAFDGNEGARNKAFHKADVMCGKLGAESVDIQDENRIAFVCRKDAPLRKLAY